MKSTVYFDTSALMKRYVEEDGSAKVASWFEAAANACTASLTYAETYCSLHRLRRSGTLRAATLTELVDRFEVDWAEMVIIELTPDVRQLIPELAAKTALRGADLVHLASALMFKGAGERLDFVTADRRLHNAALDMGLTALEL